MHQDLEWLRSKNVEIGSAESIGDRGFFEDLLADAFAFRRANGDIVDRSQFIGSVKPGAGRQTEIDSIMFVGENRAIVTCTVTMMGAGRFHNLRLFVRKSPESAWKLLAWANEPIGT